MPGGPRTRRGPLPCMSLLSWSAEGSGGTPAGAWRSMAAANFVQEMHAIGERLLLRLQRLPQAEPVEIVAFSVIVIFTATVVLLLLIAGSYCCAQCCCPARRGRKVQVGPMTPR
ncbi:small integral membrane protein 5 isoform X1 [Camelus dromedarius]|nr:small integral membrane protein 5 isoform X1 [Camelus dromedarius]